MADLGGVKEAIRTYEKIVERFRIQPLNCVKSIPLHNLFRWGEEPRLPSLSYSPRQLFWVSYARNWCSVRREAALKNQVLDCCPVCGGNMCAFQVLTDPHAPAMFRINGPLANMQEFSAVRTKVVEIQAAIFQLLWLWTGFVSADKLFCTISLKDLFDAFSCSINCRIGAVP